MIARSIRALRAARRQLFVLAFFGAPLAISCDRVPLTAPTESTIQLFSTAPSVPLNGSIDLVATITEQAGTPVHNGTLVTFTTTLGRIEPSETRTENGKATVKLVAGSQSGVAHVTALSGAATGQSSGDDTSTAGASVDVPIGAAAVGSIVLRAEPASIAPGGTAQIIAAVLDAGGNTMAGVPVAFTSTAGQLQAGLVNTNTQGEARTSLTTNVDATVTARAGVASGDTTAPSDEVTVTVAALPVITLSASPEAPSVGQPVTFTITVAPAVGGNPVTSVRIEFGDGDSANLGAVSGQTTASHTYDDDGSRTVRVTVTDAAGQQTAQALVITVSPGAPVSVVLGFDPAAPKVNQSVTFTATVGEGVVAERFDWVFGDGTTRTTTGNETTKAYTSTGIKRAKVTVTATDGSTGTGAADVVISP
jgi:PKD repeat protein